MVPELKVKNNLNDNGFLIWNHEARRKYRFFSSAKIKKKIGQPRIIYWVETNFMNKDEIKTYSWKGKLREFVTNMPMLK